MEIQVWQCMFIFLGFMEIEVEDLKYLKLFSDFKGSLGYMGFLKQ